MRRIGKSEFAKFYSGIDQNEYNKEIQLKIFNLCKNDYKKKNKIENMFNQSIKANEIGLKHEHILPLIYAGRDPLIDSEKGPTEPLNYLVTELCEYGDLFSLVDLF